MPDPILVVVPWIKVNENHMEHFIEWYAANKSRHNLKRLHTYYKATHQAQARALHMARQLNCSHILFTEDDQWGYPIDGLDVLLEADKDVIGFQTYFKDHPYNSMCCRKTNRDDSLIAMTDGNKPKVLLPFERKGGPVIQTTDLLTWAFTLVKVSVFDHMTEADKHPFKQWGPHPTDSFFCQYCEDLDIERYVHFGCTISHGAVAAKDRAYARQIYDEKHPDVVKVVLKDDLDNVYGVTEHVPYRQALESHFAKPATTQETYNGRAVNDARLV